jgi:hypothetical protein
VPAVDVRELAPGASTALRVVFRTMAFAGPMTKRVRVWSDDPERPTVDLRLRIDVSAGVVLMPPRLVFGDVLRGTTPQATLTARWKEGVGAPFRVVRTDPGPLDLEVRAEPFEAPPWKGTRLVARFRTPPPMGPVTGTLLVETDAPGQARLHVPVAAHVSGRVWTSLRAVRLGIVPEGLERRVPVVVRGFTPEVDLGEVTAAARGGRVTATAMRLAGSPKEWTVMVGVGADAAPGKLDDVVEIRTGVESEPVTEIPVSGEVVVRAR